MPHYENGVKVYRKLRDRSLKARTTNPVTVRGAESSRQSSLLRPANEPRYEPGYDIIKVDKQDYAATPRSIGRSHEDLTASTFKDFVLRTWDKETQNSKYAGNYKKFALKTLKEKKK